jgi:predicted transcriptional regulator
MSEPTPDEPEEEAGPVSQRVQLFVSDRLILVGRDATVRQMAQRMVAEGVGALIVTEGDHVHGIVSERDVVLAIAAQSDLDSTTAGDRDSRRLRIRRRAMPRVSQRACLAPVETGLLRGLDSLGNHHAG